MGRKRGRKYVLKLLVNERVLELLGKECSVGQVTERQGYSKGTIPPSVPWECSRKQYRANQDTCIYSHLRIPQSV